MRDLSCLPSASCCGTAGGGGAVLLIKLARLCAGSELERMTEYSKSGFPPRSVSNKLVTQPCPATSTAHLENWKDFYFISLYLTNIFLWSNQLNNRQGRPKPLSQYQWDHLLTWSMTYVSKPYDIMICWSDLDMTDWPSCRPCHWGSLSGSISRGWFGRWQQLHWDPLGLTFRAPGFSSFLLTLFWWIVSLNAGQGELWVYLVSLKQKLTTLGEDVGRCLTQ